MLPFNGNRGSGVAVILTESYGRYASAFGDSVVNVRMAKVATDSGEMPAATHDLDWIEVNAAEVVPEALLKPVITPAVARREILARFLALSGPVTVAEVEARYGWDPRWIEERLTEWQRTGKLVVGKFRLGSAGVEWCSRKVAELGRRRALAALRKQIEAVELPAFAEFLQRWQHVDSRDQLSGFTGVASYRTASALRMSRPANAWERDYLKSRVVDYDPSFLSQLAATGELVWVAEPAEALQPTGAAPLGNQVLRAWNGLTVDSAGDS